MSGHRFLVFGATGLVGSGVVHALLQAQEVSSVRVIGRRTLGIQNSKLHEVHCDDFLCLDPLKGAFRDIDALCFCLGISASQAGSKEEYRRITHDFALEAGRALLAGSPNAVFHFVSGSGTSEKSFMNWARVKGQTERDLSELGLGGCVHWRPAMVLPEFCVGKLSSLQRVQATLVRPFQGLSGLSVSNIAIGEAMLQATLEGRRAGALENAEIRRVSDKRRKASGSA